MSEQQRTRTRRWSPAALVAGLLGAGLGGVVLYGWHVGSETLVRGGTSWTPMQYNTALGLVSAGLALMLLSLRADRLARALGLVLVVAGAATAAQYLSGLDFGIDRAFFEPWKVTRRAYPGRMSPQTAIAFVLFGGSVLWTRRTPLLASALAIALILLGGLSLAGYVMMVRPAFAWGRTTPIAPHASLAFLILGAGLAALASRDLAVDRPAGRWIAYVAGTACLLGSVAFAGAIAQQERTLVTRVVHVARDSLAREIRSQLRAQTAGLQHLQTRLPTLDAAFRACRPTTRLLMRTPNGPSALEWVTPTLTIRRRTSRLDPTTAAATRTLAPAERAAFRAQDAESGVFTTPPRALPDGRAFFRIVMPVHYGTRRIGFVSGFFLVNDFLQGVVGTDRPLYDVTLASGDVTFFDSGLDGNSLDWRETTEIVLPGDVMWLITLAPSQRFQTVLDTGLPEFVLAAGILLSVLGAMTIRGWQRVAAQTQNLLATNRALREQVESHRREAEARISAEDQLRLAQRPLAPPDARRHRLNLEEDLRRFASFVSHELRQPLASMQIFVKLLESRLGDAEGTREYLEELQANVARMASSIEAQLALVRAVTSDEDASFEIPIDLDALLAEIAETVAAPLAEAGGTITIEPLTAVEGNPDQVRQVFRNLLENAVKYRHPERPPVITVRAAVTEHGMCEVAVADNGSGFAPEETATMFTMFHRLDPSRASGSGVGLALCRRIVERHGGTIRAEGRPGEGATFVVSLPVASSRRPA